MIMIHEEKVVEISADLLGRGHAGIDAEFLALRKCREYARQHVSLYAVCQGEFCIDSLLFGRYPAVFIDVGPQFFIHFLDRSRHSLYLVACMDVYLHALFAVQIVHEPAYRILQSFKRFYYLPAN